MAEEKILMFFFLPKISEMRLGRWCMPVTDTLDILS